jgi:hypothetical protein
MGSNDIRLVLDFRNFDEAPTTPQEFQDFWRAFESVLIAQKRIPANRPLEIHHPKKGLLVVSAVNATEDALITSNTQFSVVSLLERPKRESSCNACAEPGRTSAAPYHCHACESGHHQSHYCEAHTVILEGGISPDGLIRTSCKIHTPICRDCSSVATFWCHGPSCRGYVAWCNDHRRYHPQRPNVGYCPTCYNELFPRCAVPNCNEPGINRCEHVNVATGDICGEQLCNRHVARWQVFGPLKIGLNRCNRHRSIPALTDAELAWQLVAGTAYRAIAKSRNKDKRNGPSERYELPRLGAFAHVLRNSRGYAYDRAATKSLYLSVQSTLQNQNNPSSKVAEQMSRVLQESSKSWQAELTTEGDNWKKGLPYLELLQAELTKRGLNELAQSVTHTAFIPQRIDRETGKEGAAHLFIRVPAHLKQMIANPYGKVRAMYSEAVGCRVVFEREQQQ